MMVLLLMVLMMTTTMFRKLAEDTRVKTVMINIGDGCTLVTKL